MSIDTRDAATVMLVRDSDEGLEVFMLRRNLNSDFVGGAYVFPGGAVEPQDLADDIGPLCAGRTDRDACGHLGVATGGLSFWVAAIRESFEEAGVLLARDRDGEVLQFSVPEVRERFAAHRRAVDTGARSLSSVCIEEGLQLDVASMHYFAHWITPEGAPRRYDTRFFVAHAPEHQTPAHDDRETVANLWVRPADALARHAAGELEMIFPTIRTLEAIGRFERADDLLAHAASIAEVPTILPKLISDRGGWRIVLPGDPEYDEVSGADLSGGIPASALLPRKPE